jgi:hypothetical protein
VGYWVKEQMTRTFSDFLLSKVRELQVFMMVEMLIKRLLNVMRMLTAIRSRNTKFHVRKVVHEK